MMCSWWNNFLNAPVVAQIWDERYSVTTIARDGLRSERVDWLVGEFKQWLVREWAGWLGGQGAAEGRFCRQQGQLLRVTFLRLLGCSRLGREVLSLPERWRTHVCEKCTCSCVTVEWWLWLYRLHFYECNPVFIWLAMSWYICMYMRVWLLLSACSSRKTIPTHNVAAAESANHFDVSRLRWRLR